MRYRLDQAFGASLPTTTDWIRQTIHDSATFFIPPLGTVRSKCLFIIKLLNMQYRSKVTAKNAFKIYVKCNMFNNFKWNTSIMVVFDLLDMNIQHFREKLIHHLYLIYVFMLDAFVLLVLLPHKKSFTGL